MGKLFAITLDGRVYSCKHCELTSPSPMTSCPGVNVTVGEKEERLMITGMHTVMIRIRSTSKESLYWFKVLGPDGGIYLPVVEGHYSGSEED